MRQLLTNRCTQLLTRTNDSPISNAPFGLILSIFWGLNATLLLSTCLSVRRVHWSTAERRCSLLKSHCSVGVDLSSVIASRDGLSNLQSGHSVSGHCKKSGPFHHFELSCRRSSGAKICRIQICRYVTPLVRVRFVMDLVNAVRNTRFVFTALSPNPKADIQAVHPVCYNARWDLEGRTVLICQP